MYGELELLAGDRIFTARSGDFIFVPRGTRHRFKPHGFPLAVPRTDTIDASDQQPLVNPQGTVAFWAGEAIAMGTAVGGVVVVAVSPSVILPLDTIGAVPPFVVSSPSAVAKAPAATSAAPATSIARIFVDCCMNVPPGLCGTPPYYVRMC